MIEINKSKELKLTQFENQNLNFCVFRTVKYFVYKISNTYSKYLTIPNFVKFYKKKDSIVFFYTKDSYSILFLSFLNTFSIFLKNSNKIFSKKLVLKGLGFRINIADDASSIKFKLGLSHLVDCIIPKDKVQVSVKKNTLNIQGNDLNFLGNFCNKIKNFKKPNSYNGKGFWFKKEKIVLKTFKKSK